MHESEPATIAAIRELFRYIPQNNVDDPPRGRGTDPRDRRDEALLDVVPDNPNKPYDMHDVIRRVVDDGEFYEVQRDYAANILCGFAHLGGFSIGIVANQPAVLAGVLDINASLKAARFIRFCDAFNIPIVTFEDVPGFLPGVAQEHGGIIKHGAKLLYRLLRGDGAQAHGHHAQGVRRRVRRHVVEAHSRRLQRRVAHGRDRGDGAQGRGGDSLSQGDQRERRTRSRRPTRRSPSTREKFAHPYIAAGRGYVDDIIDPRDTRPRLIDALETLRTKRDRNPPKKHGNIPL